LTPKPPRGREEGRKGKTELKLKEERVEVEGRKEGEGRKQAGGRKGASFHEQCFKNKTPKLAKIVIRTKQQF
jgi:hypothetical protein